MKLSNEEFELFSSEVVNMLKNSQMRSGQCMFNTLYQINPVIADSIRGTELDCFYQNKRIKKFLTEICTEEQLGRVNPKLLL